MGEFSGPWASFNSTGKAGLSARNQVKRGQMRTLRGSPREKAFNCTVNRRSKFFKLPSRIILGQNQPNSPKMTTGPPQKVTQKRVQIRPNGGTRHKNLRRESGQIKGPRMSQMQPPKGRFGAAAVGPKPEVGLWGSESGVQSYKANEWTRQRPKIKIHFSQK